MGMGMVYQWVYNYQQKGEISFTYSHSFREIDCIRIVALGEVITGISGLCIVVVFHRFALNVDKEVVSRREKKFGEKW